MFRLGYPLARAWWLVRQPVHEGALVAVYVGPALLLLRASYRKTWNLPGGGVKRGETPEAAARRELAEEIGLDAPALQPTGAECGDWDNRHQKVHFFELRLDRLPPLRLDNREIIGAELVLPEDLDRFALTAPVGIHLGRPKAEADG